MSSRRSSPARSPASPFRDRAAAVLLQQPVRRLPDLRWPGHQQKRSTRRWLCRSAICPARWRHCPGRSRVLALLHPDAGSLGKHYGFKLKTAGTTSRQGQDAILHGTGRGRSPSSMTTACAPTDDEDLRGRHPNLERRWKETDSAWVREEIERYMSATPPARPVTATASSPRRSRSRSPAAHRRGYRAVDPQAGRLVRRAAGTAHRQAEPRSPCASSRKSATG
jgi:hypothetical protein